MDVTTIVIVIAVVVAVPLGMAWIQSRWELRHERRSRTRHEAAAEDDTHAASTR